MVVTVTTFPGGYRERNSTADRTLTILGMFSDNRLHISAGDVADALDCARSTAYRYLQTLVSTSFLEEAPGGGFRLGIRVMELARLARRSFSLTEIALPVMRALADELGETVLLTRLVDNAVICIERCEGSSQLIRLSYERGTRLPINAGASALVLLAWLHETQARDLLAGEPLQCFTESTLVDIESLMNRLSEIRTNSFSVSVAEVDPDVIGVAAPVFGDDGSVVAALSVVTMRCRVPSQRLDELVSAISAASNKLSRQISVVS
ncbi:IclR family transcriptional regulator [Rhodococcus sp. AD45-ID]|nr:IclR family transcriptional regulator [Rhodococcus sp. AD45-ID]